MLVSRPEKGIGGRSTGTSSTTISPISQLYPPKRHPPSSPSRSRCATDTASGAHRGMLKTRYGSRRDGTCSAMPCLTNCQSWLMTPTSKGSLTSLPMMMWIFFSFPGLKLHTMQGGILPSLASKDPAPKAWMFWCQFASCQREWRVKDPDEFVQTYQDL